MKEDWDKEYTTRGTQEKCIKFQFELRKEERKKERKKEHRHFKILVVDSTLK
jgi:hypothetical protein